tara:strand:+ start:796 stop:1926 length:1131 start_codon:yes stop_codon:yes gene_type:complete
MNFFHILFLLIPIIGFSQDTPQGISYQAVAYDSEGFEISNQDISIRLGILLGAVDAEASYTEVHSVTTDNFGMFSLVISEGETSDAFASINWEEGAYLKVEVDTNLDGEYNIMGVSSFNAVPYALYAEKTNSEVTVSSIGDTLTINGESLVIPGISYQNTPSTAFGSVTDIEGNTYQTIDLGYAGEWMIEDLRTTSFSNGDPINLITGSNSWNANICTSPGYVEHNGVYRYNGYTIDDARNICPVGWSVPSVQDYEVILDSFNDGEPSHNNSGTSYAKEWDNAGKALKSPSESPDGEASWSHATNHSYLSFFRHNQTSCNYSYQSVPTSDINIWTSSDSPWNSPSKWALRLNEGIDRVHIYDWSYQAIETVRCKKN